MRLLVTGATGFLGAHTCRELVSRGHQVRAFGRDFSGFAIAGAEIVRGDLRDADAIRRICAGMDGVVHTGALSSPWGKLEDFMAVNVTGTRSVLEACAATGVRRLVHVSSPAVIFTRDRLELVVLRPKAIYGPGDRALLPRMVSAARSRRLPQVGTGENLIDLTFIDDAVRAIVLALERPPPCSNFPVYTITSGEHVNLWRLIRRVLEALGIPSTLRLMPVGTMLMLAGWLERMAGISGREPALTRYGVELLARTQTYDISRAKSDLGFEPRCGLEFGLERTLEALR
jgi:2-alkyl-3-oxoalkanoate reductase